MEKVIIVDKKKFEKIKKNISLGGKDKIHILSDFDKTLTKGFVEGQKAHTVIAQLRQGNYLTPDYSPKAHALFDKYHPIEIDPNISFEEKKKQMHKWWKEHYELLVKSGLDKKTIQKIVSTRTIQFREGIKDFLKILQENNIPLVIISAALGDMLVEYFRQDKFFSKNIEVISNFYEWGKNGKAAKVREPIIHSMNKDETVVEDFPEIFEKIKERKNVILLGDGLEDPKMVEGFDYENLLRIGFLNENVDENLDSFKKNYDVILLGDPNMKFVNGLLEEIVGK